MAGQSSPRVPHGADVLLVDGTCIFCNRLVAFVLRHDRKERFYFSHLQGAVSRAALARHGRDPEDLDGVYLLARAGTAEEELLVDGQAGRVIWPSMFKAAAVMRWIPLPLLNLFYRWFARCRYRLFGQAAACIVPTPEARRRFLDGAEPPWSAYPPSGLPKQ
jgi:predicted DCC family thiol-disulfide oxidoreductase YuxK